MVMDISIFLPTKIVTVVDTVWIFSKYEGSLKQLHGFSNNSKFFLDSTKS